MTALRIIFGVLVYAAAIFVVGYECGKGEW